MTEAISPDLKIEAFGSHHNRAGFACGVESLDRYFKTQANQDVKRKINGVFVLVNLREPAEVLGYYTLCATSLAQGDVPEAARKHVPRYPYPRGPPGRRRPSTKTGVGRTIACGCSEAGLYKREFYWLFHAHRRRHQRAGCRLLRG